MLERLGKYEILELIGTGGLGTVYHARDTILNRVVAIKVIEQSLADDPEFLQALQREVQSAGRLDHPNITTVHDFEIENGVAYLVMDYVPDSVDRHLVSGRHLTWRRSVEIALQVCHALQHAHEQGVIHRNIKPQNILLQADGTVSVTDFGIVGALASTTTSTAAQVLGTPHYRSVEQWDDDSVDGRSDVYSLGITFYEMLSGSLPYQGDSAEAISVLHREAQMPSLPESLQVPRVVAEVVQRAMEKSPESRYASADAMATALEDLLSGRAFDPPEFIAARARSPRPRNGPPALPPPGSRSGSGYFGRFPGRYWLTGAVIAAISAIAILAAVFAVSSGGDDGGGALAVAPAPTATVTPSPTPATSPTQPLSTIAPTRSPITAPEETAVPVTPTPAGIPEPTATPGPTATPSPTFTPRPTPTPVFLDYYNRGIAFLNDEQYLSAISEFTTAISLDPTFVDAYSQRAIAYSKMDDWFLAVEDLARAIQLDPNDPILYVNRADNLALLKLDRLAVNDYNQAVSLDLSVPGGFRGLGEAYERLKLYSEAQEAFGQALRIDPLDEASVRGKASINLIQGLYVSAIDGYSQLIFWSPANPSYLYGRGLARYLGNTFEDSLIDIQQAISFELLNAEFYYLRSLVHKKLGNLDFSTADLDTSCTLKPTLDPDLVSLLPLQICPP